MNEKLPHNGQKIDPLSENTGQEGQGEMIFSADNPYQIHHTPQTWYQQNADIVFPLFIIAIGLFQYVLRKWILPVDRDIIFQLEDQFPSQGIMYHPGVGVFIMITGFIMLLLFNLDLIF